MPEIESLPDGTSHQRNNLNHQAIEDYLKTIYTLAQEESPVSTSRIADAREVKPASATSMIKRLANLKMVDYEKHYGVTLTPSGEKLALEVIRHHRLIELYLMEALGFSWDEVHEQADILEHVISEKLEERIAAALNYPEFDPHGDPIPAKDGSITAIDVELLSAVPSGSTVWVRRIIDDANSELLRYLAEMGLTPGTAVTVQSVAPFEGPLTLLIADETRVIGRNVAASVLVEFA
ncbi:MAG: metal-dependent transcriptional regulator [Ardenticatenaceae bacterium]|nr:metal-dependent transcriptional regulator [Ardenticatenaceae bacterium]MCB8946426.1 metal-dependent transcriptional regulator [Ardenticatenaceae bacterium]